MSSIEKAKALLEEVKALKSNQADGLVLIEEGLNLPKLPPEILAQFYEAKCLYLHRMGKPQEGLILYEEYNAFLQKNPELILNKISLKRFHMLFLYALGKKERAVQVGENIIRDFSASAEDDVEKKLCDIYWITGGLATNIGQYEKCMQYFNRALELCEKHDLNNLRISIYAALGDVYRSNQEPDKAISYLELGINLSKETHVSNVTSTMLTNLAVIYQSQGKNEQAEQVFQEALQISEQIKHPRAEALALVRLAKFYCQEGKTTKFNKTVERLNENIFYTSKNHLQTEMLAVKSEMLLHENKLDEALDLATQFEEIRLEEKGLLDILSAYELQIKILKALGRDQEVVHYYEKLLEVKEQILNEANKKHLQEFEMKFQNERKEKEIQALKLESVSFQLQSLRAQMNPHFVFNTIASISNDIKADSVDKSKKLLGSFARLMRANLEFAEQDKITLEDEIKFLQDYLKLEQNRLGDKLTFSVHYDEDMDLDFIEIPSMLLQPYIENAIKHGIMPLTKAGQINISFEEKEDTLLCTIEDNGVGRKKAKNMLLNAEKHLGKSTSINQRRLDLLAPEIKEGLKVKYTDCHDYQGNSTGTMVEISIPL